MNLIMFPETYGYFPLPFTALQLFTIAYVIATIALPCNSYHSIAIITIKHIRNGKGCPSPDDNLHDVAIGGEQLILENIKDKYQQTNLLNRMFIKHPTLKTTRYQQIGTLNGHEECMHSLSMTGRGDLLASGGM